MSRNIHSLQEIYNCFTRGDFVGVQTHLADDIAFFNEEAPTLINNDADKPVQEARCRTKGLGPNGLVQFFTTLENTIQTTRFEPFEPKEEGRQISNRVQYEGIVRSTGKSFSLDLLFVWSFNRAGQANLWKITGDFGSLKNASSR